MRTRRYENLGAYLAGTKTTQVTFAARLGIQQSTVSRIVSGELQPGLALALRIVAATNHAITVESLCRERAA